MDEYGDWVYIILMVVVGISSLIGSINKKKRQQEMQMPVPEYSDEPSFPIPSVPTQQERKQPPPAPKQPKRQPFSTLSSAPTVVTVSPSETFFKPEEEHTIADELDLSDADAFRKAVIYSEILHRKY
jgi:hypothetical protein